jgi:hypothetical protein
MTDWPDDADGDVLRRMARSGFDFEKPSLIDFDVDFEAWPPAPDALVILSREFPSSIVHPPSEDLNGYVQFQVFEKVTYALVTRMQAHVSELMSPYGGVCESWGVLH